MAALMDSTFKLIPLWKSRSIRETARFYRDHLHTKVSEFYPSEDNPRFVSVVWGKHAAANIYFTIHEPDQGESFIAGDAMVAMGVDELEPWYEELRANREVHIKEEMSDKPWGHRSFTITDPDGNCLTFFKMI